MDHSHSSLEFVARKLRKATAQPLFKPFRTWLATQPAGNSYDLPSLGHGARRCAANSRGT